MKVLLPILFAGLAASSALGAKIDLPGEVTYLERIALPEGATLRLELIDLALPDLPRLSVSAPTGSGQVPLSFTLTLEDSLILPHHNYALKAEIRAADFLFRNTDPYPVTPLAQIEPISIVTSPVTETEEPPIEPTEEPPLAILNVNWQATMIGDVAVPANAQITLLIEPDMRAGGMGGCNSYFAQAQLADSAFAVSDVAKTMRSCLYERNMLEQSFFDALKAARMWRIDNGALLLLDSTGKTLVQFTS